MVIAGVGFVFQRGRWRWYSGMLLAQLIMVIGMEGSVEIFRFFSLVYCLSAPLLAWIVSDSAPRISRSTRFVLAGLVWVFMLASVGFRHHQIATFVTMDWQFRPMLSKGDARFHASHAEKGEWYLLYPAARNFIDDEERVLLLGSHYPFYLHRNALWNDEVLGAGGLADRWRRMRTEEARRFLEREKIDVILYAAGKGPSAPATGAPAGEASPVAELVAAGDLKKVNLPEELSAKGWTLHKVDR